MADPYVGEIRMVGFNFAPIGWAICAGQLLPISQYDVLFQLIGTTYGGDGQSTFALPSLQSRVPIHQGTGPGLSTFVMGQMAGTETVTLTSTELAVHTHSLYSVNNTDGNTISPEHAYSARSSAGDQVYFSQPQAGQLQSMEANIVSLAGGNQPHANIQPLLAINFVICLEGIYPSQS